MNRLITLSAIVVIAVLGHASVAVADQITLFSDDFNSYDTSLPLAGQGGWVLDPFGASSVMLSNSTPLGSSVGVDGLLPTCKCIAYARHQLSRPLSSDDITVLSFDAYAFSEYRSHNAGVLLADANDHVIQALFAWDPQYPANAPGWEIAGFNQVNTIYGGFDEPVAMQLVIDGPLNQFYLRLIYSGGTSESAHLDIGSYLIGNLTDLVVFEDYRSSGNLGIDIDNVAVTATTPSSTPVPEPSSAMLLLSGLVAAMVVRRRHYPSLNISPAKSKKF